MTRPDFSQVRTLLLACWALGPTALTLGAGLLAMEWVRTGSLDRNPLRWDMLALYALGAGIGWTLLTVVLLIGKRSAR